MGVTLASRYSYVALQYARLVVPKLNAVVKSEWWENQMYVKKCRLWTCFSTVEWRIGDHIEILLKFVLEFAIEGWRTICRLKNVDHGRVLVQSNDGFGDHIGILLKFVLGFAIEDWITNCRLKNADYGRVLAVEWRIGDHIQILFKYYGAPLFWVPE